MSVLRLIVALFAVSQLVPAGASLAQEGEGFALVMCTPEGVKVVSWEEATGEPSPFDMPAENEHSDSSPCHACAAGGCSGGVGKGLRAYIPNVALMQPAPILNVETPVFVRANIGPPLPSRAPPFFA